MAAGVASLVGALLLPAILYFSPARTVLYQALDGEYRAHREMLGVLRDSLSQSDMQIRLADSTRAALLAREQPSLWKRYGYVRQATLRLAQSQASPSLAGLKSWLAGLWFLPVMVLAALLPLCYWLLRRLEKGESHPETDSQEKEPFRRSHTPGRPAFPEPAPRWGPQIEDPDWEDTRYMAVSIVEDAPLKEPFPEEAPPLAGSSELSMEDEEPVPDAFEENEFDRAENRKKDVLRLARKGITSSEISRRLRMSQDQVEMIIRLKRDKG